MAGSSETTPYDTDFFAWLGESSGRSARVIVPIVLSYIQPGSVIDIGCGTGAWLKAFQEAGVADILGCDGAYVDQTALLIDPACFRVVDLREGMRPGRKFDLAVSLEVAEHLPPRFAETFIGLLTSVAPAVLFSAAIPGQGGVDHVNEQWQDYWRALFAAKGFQPVDCVRPKVRGLSTVEEWFQQNVILYCDPGFLSAHPALSPVELELSLNQVHPSLFERVRTPGVRELSRMIARLARGKMGMA